MDEQLSQGIGLFNDGEFFRCHEALFLQALIHLAVGFYHAKRGNTVGAVRQLRKGIEKLAAYTPSCEGMDTARLYREALAAAQSIEAEMPLSAYPQIHEDTSSYPRSPPSR